MNKINNDKNRRREELRERYSRMHENGASLYISATPDEVARMCVREEIHKHERHDIGSSRVFTQHIESRTRYGKPE